MSVENQQLNQKLPSPLWGKWATASTAETLIPPRMRQRFLIWRTLVELAEPISAEDLAGMLALKVNSVGPRLTEMSRLNLVDWGKVSGVHARLWMPKAGVTRFPLSTETWSKVRASLRARKVGPTAAPEPVVSEPCPEGAGEPIMLGELYAAKPRPQGDVLSSRSLPPIPVVHAATPLPAEHDSFVEDVIAHIDMLSEADLKTLVESLQFRTFKRLRQIVLES